MKKIGHYEFPETPEETKAWDPPVLTHALARRVLAVAHMRLDGGGSWAAYIDAVPGKSHENERDLVLSDGVKLVEHIAREMFGSLEDIPYAR